MRNSFNAFSMLVFCVATLACHVHAAEFTILNAQSTGSGDLSPVCEVRLSGPIVPGDAQRLEAALTEANRRRGGPTAVFIDGSTLCLQSAGGSYDEGLRIAKLLLEHDIATAIEPNASCFSACAIIFMAGGRDVEGTHVPDRTLHVTGRLGFHAPYITGVNEKNYSADELEGAYRQSVQAIRDLMRLSKTRRVTDDFMPKIIIAEMLDKGPNELFLIDTVYKAAKINIHLYGAPKLPVTVPGLCNACMTMHNDSGIESSLDAAPTGCASSSQQISRRGNQIWFGGFGGEGAWYCVAQVPGAFGTEFNVSRTLIATTKRQVEQENLVLPPDWYLFPGATKIRDLQ